MIYDVIYFVQYIGSIQHITFRMNFNRNKNVSVCNKPVILLKRYNHNDFLHPNLQSSRRGRSITMV